MCALAALGDGRLASASEDCTCKVWNVLRAECLATLASGTHARMWCVAVIAPSQFISADDDAIAVWDI